MASRVRAVDNHAQRFGDALLLAGPAPELGDRAFERQANLSFAVRVSLEINHADFLLEAAALLHEKHGISVGKLGFEHQQGAARCDRLLYCFYLERAEVSGTAVHLLQSAHRT